MTARESYLGWDELHHFRSCTQPVWTVDVRTEANAFRHRDRDSTVAHSCPDEACGHRPQYERITVRIVCRTCTAVHLVVSETDVRFTQARDIGYGLPPRRHAGLLLWPGEPLLSYGRLAGDEPWDFLVTGPGVSRPQREDIVGEITQGRGARGAVRWSAAALPGPGGEYGYGDNRWAAIADGLRSPVAAAKWIADQRPAPGTAVRS